MKKLVLPLLILSAGNTFAQNTTFDSQFNAVRNELVGWDNVRGEWLAQSMVAMSSNQQVPDRNFPEKFAPAEMYMAMPANVRNNVQQIVTSQTNGSDSTTRQQWTAVNQFISRPVCSATQGRSYGDPHLTSFDGSAFSFQTVGEFTLVKSQSGHFNVQVRQRAEGQSVSLNSAVAMWVNGDRVCFYASTYPDGNRSTPFRVDGQAVYIENGTYYLNHGGVISGSRNEYIITWPTGERVKLDRTSFGTGDFVNVAVEIFPCADNYNGVLGNANGRQSDDFDVNGRNTNMNMGVFASSDPGSDALQRQYQAFLAQDFASQWRVTQQTSLFDYGFGESTTTFTDVTFPQVYQTIGDLNQTNRDRARRDCERQGFTGAALNACIYDNGFLRIPPTPQPSVPVVVRNPITTPVVTPVRNVNPGGRLPIPHPAPTVNPTPTPTPVTGEVGKAVEPKVHNTVNPVANGTEGATKDNGGASTQPVNGGGAQPMVKGENTTSGTTTKTPNPYEPPVEPERKPFRVNSPNNGGLGSGGSSGSGSSSSGSSSGSGSSSTPRSNPPVSVPTPRPTPTPTPMPAPKPAPAPAPAPAPSPTISVPKGGLIRKP